MKRLDLAPGFAAALCLLRLLAEPRVFYAFLAAAAAHEAGLGYRQEIFCALAGPGMSVLVCLALRKAYATCAAISLLLGLFNAMPVYPLDGGRALRAGLCLVLPLGRAEAVSNIAGLAVCAAGLAGAVFCARAYGLGFAPVALWLVVFARVLRHGHEEGLVSRAPVRYNK